jgi:hypothetical protein
MAVMSPDDSRIIDYHVTLESSGPNQAIQLGFNRYQATALTFGS